VHQFLCWVYIYLVMCFGVLRWKEPKE
jgi:hypothetical protein